MENYRATIGIIALTLILILTAGCCTQTTPYPDPNWSGWESAQARYTAFQEWTRQNPCGSLSIRPPLFNVTGHLSGTDNYNRSLRLHIAPNTTADAALYVIDNCARLGYIDVQQNGMFTVGALPEGDYVLVTWKDPWAYETVRPEIFEYNQSNFTIKMETWAADKTRSLLAFSVRPSRNEVTK